LTSTNKIGIFNIMTWLNMAEYGRMHGVSRQRVQQWIFKGQLQCWRPKKGTYLIDAKTPRPKKGKQGRIPDAIRNKLLSM
jgi:hypothetical protein